MTDIKEIHSLFLNSNGVSTDTRYISENQMFFALKGGNFNGNKYALSAIESGASYAVIDESEFAVSKQFILVDNVLKTLQKLAKFHREYLDIPIIGITGTNGKTTTKELVYSVLSKKYKVVATKGNLNNHIGVPLTLLSMKKDTEYGIVEMGANHIGEIAELCSISNPDFGLITNIGAAHLEGFGSLEGVKKAKNELYNHIAKKNAKLFVNADDSLLMKLSQNISKYTYGQKIESDCIATKLQSSTFFKLLWNNNKILTKLVGNYNFDNILASICIGVYFNVDELDIINAIQEYEPGNNRSQFVETKYNKLIIDAYNANPTSMAIAIKNFSTLNADNKLLIIGDMFELGNTSYIEHEKIINLLQELNLNHVYLIGNEFSKFKEKLEYRFFNDTSGLNTFLKKENIKDRFILLKASRGIELEKSIAYL